jgi:CelD/BcsL family acetyltransferase involved in cellulose biosynthesis
MLDRASSQTDDFVLTVHRGAPADWPGINDLGDARAHVFQTREFMGIWAETLGAGDHIDARFVDVRDRDGRMVLRLPLAIEIKQGIRVLGFADQSCADYCAPILYPTAIEWTVERVTALWSSIEAALPPNDKVVLEKMPAMVGDLVNPLYLLSGESNPESCHGSVLTRPWPEIEKTQAQLTTLKRKARGLEKLGTVRFIVATDAAERERLLARLLEQKQRRFEETQVPGFAESPATRDFFVRATTLFAETGNLHLAALEVGGELIATSWTVAVGKTIYELMIGFEAGDWFKHSPGRVLNLRYLEWAKAQGFTYLDHGIGDEDWKRENCDTHVALGRLVAVRTAKGRRQMAKAALIARIRSTRIYERLRPYKWIVKRAIARRLGRAA